MHKLNLGPSKAKKEEEKQITLSNLTFAEVIFLLLFFLYVLSANYDILPIQRCIVEVYLPNFQIRILRLGLKLEKM